MRLQVRILGRELLTLQHDRQSEPVPPPQPAPQPEPEPDIPAGFGFHGGAGGSQEHNWQVHAPRPVDGR